MTDTTGTGTVPEAQGAALLQKPGDFVRGKREAAGMTQAQVGAALHLTVHYIKSLENDEYGKLPGLTFVKGYFRAYARLLKLDEAALLDCYDSYIRSLGLQESPQEQTLRVRRRNDQAILWAIVAGVILVIGLGSGWWFFGRQDEAAPVAAVTSSRSTAAAASSAAPTATPPARSTAGLQNDVRPTAPATTFAVQPPAAAVAAPAVSAAAPGDPTAGQAPDVVATATPPNSTLLMTEDGPVVLPAATPADSGATADAAADLPAVVDGTTAAPVLQQAPDAPGAAPVVPAAAVQTPDANTVAAGTVVTPDAAVVAPAALAPASGVAPAAAGTVATTSTGTNTRRVELVGAGADQLELQFSGNSWVEVDDGARVRLYSDMMRSGDALSIKAAAPFRILLGDATGVAVLLNGQPLPIAASIRSDKTARIMISAEGVSAWAVE